MKKIVTITMASVASLLAKADDYGLRAPEVFRALAIMLLIGMFMYFILTIMKRIFEHRLKNKILDKGMSETIATSILSTHGNENKNTNIKWFAILAGLGIGLTGVNYTQPLGFHSLAIMAFSISLSFLGYYFFTRNKEK